MVKAKMKICTKTAFFVLYVPIELFKRKSQKNNKTKIQKQRKNRIRKGLVKA